MRAEKSLVENDGGSEGDYRGDGLLPRVQVQLRFPGLAAVGEWRVEAHERELEVRFEEGHRLGQTGCHAAVSLKPFYLDYLVFTCLCRYLGPGDKVTLSKMAVTVGVKTPKKEELKGTLVFEKSKAMGFAELMSLDDAKAKFEEDKTLEVYVRSVVSVEMLCTMNSLANRNIGAPCTRKLLRSALKRKCSS